MRHKSDDAQTMLAQHRCRTTWADENEGTADATKKNETEKKKGSSLLSFLFNLEREKRLELSTYTLARYRSTN